MDTTPIPAGWYAMAIDNAVYRNHNGKDLVTIVFRVEDGEHRGRLVFDNFYLTEKAKPYSMKSIHNIVDDCGLDYDGTDEELVREIAALKGQALDVKVYVDEKGDYKPRNRYGDSAPAWTHVRRGVGTTPQSASVQTPPRTTAKPAEPEQADSVEDDMPF